jgi:hypothetical protein
MRLLLFFISLFLMGLAQSTPITHPDFQPVRENIELKATATAKWMAFISVYDAGLYADVDAKASEVLQKDMPISLEIRYRVDVKKEQLIEAANVALKRQHKEDTCQKFQAFVDDLHRSYQDVKEGDRFRIDVKPDSGLSLYFNGQLRYQNTDLDFANYYVGLWLAENPLSDNVRTALLNWSL